MPKALPVIDLSAPVCCAPVSAAPMADDAALEIALRLKALADPAVRKRIEDTGSLVVGNSPAQFTQQIAAEYEIYRKTVERQNLKPD